MKKSIFEDIRSFEDLQKRRLRLEKKLKLTGKSLSEKTDITKVLSVTKKGTDGFNSKEDYKLLIFESLLPLGINFIVKLIKNNPDKKLLRKMIIYSIYGSISALLVYKLLNYRKSDTNQ